MEKLPKHKSLQLWTHMICLLSLFLPQFTWLAGTAQFSPLSSSQLICVETTLTCHSNRKEHQAGILSCCGKHNAAQETRPIERAQPIRLLLMYKNVPWINVNIFHRCYDAEHIILSGHHGNYQVFSFLWATHQQLPLLSSRDWVGPAGFSCKPCVITRWGWLVLYKVIINHMKNMCSSSLYDR